MPFMSLSLYNFRNLSNDSIDLSGKEIFFIGINGQGKSNLLEALYYVSYGASFRTKSETEVIKNGQPDMSIRTLFKDSASNIIHSTFFKIENKTKKIEKDGKILHDRKELINTIPCVLFNHDDLDFAVGAPERRRFFIDQSLSMYDVYYIDILRKFKRILKNRNLCLKEKKYDLLESYNFQLASAGLEIIKKRKSAIFQFNQIFGKLYEQISGIKDLYIKYEPSWNSEWDVNLIEKYISSKFDLEKYLNTTVTGPHRDKIIFVKNGVNFIPNASTGQRRLVALSLRNAQAVFYKQITNKKPILLMDDVMLELDPEKRERFTSLLPEYDQLFCTFLPGEPYKRYIHEESFVYTIENGFWSFNNG